MSSEKINIYDFIEEQSWWYMWEIARHVWRSQSWVSQSLRRGVKSLDIKKEIAKAISKEEWYEYSYRDFDWEKRK